jgi:dihydroorotase-like cyclic amidohydrolase
VEKTGCPYHICHVSTKESVALIRAAKREGLDVTCETAPHYLLLDETDLQEDGRFKMNPPLRAPADREALVEGVLDGTVDMIATDHAPHSAAERRGDSPAAPSASSGWRRHSPRSIPSCPDRRADGGATGRAAALNPRKRFRIRRGRLLRLGSARTIHGRPGALRLDGPRHALAGREVYGK